jgi:GNAT superfamily N-acetyltransferase
MRFDQPGEALVAAYSDEALAAIGGITIDPVVPNMLRMRRFYVRPAFRRTGIGREIAQALPQDGPKRSGGDPQCCCKKRPVLGKSRVRAGSSRRTHSQLA